MTFFEDMKLLKLPDDSTAHNNHPVTSSFISRSERTHHMEIISPLAHHQGLLSLQNHTSLLLPPPQARSANMCRRFNVRYLCQHVRKEVQSCQSPCPPLCFWFWAPNWVWVDREPVEEVSLANCPKCRNSPPWRKPGDWKEHKLGNRRERRKTA